MNIAEIFLVKIVFVVRVLKLLEMIFVIYIYTCGFLDFSTNGEKTNTSYHSTLLYFQLINSSNFYRFVMYIFAIK